MNALTTVPWSGRQDSLLNQSGCIVNVEEPLTIRGTRLGKAAFKCSNYGSIFSWEIEKKI